MAIISFIFEMQKDRFGGFEKGHFFINHVMIEAWN